MINKLQSKSCQILNTLVTCWITSSYSLKISALTALTSLFIYNQPQPFSSKVELIVESHWQVHTSTVQTEVFQNKSAKLPKSGISFLVTKIANTYSEEWRSQRMKEGKNISYTYRHRFIQTHTHAHAQQFYVWKSFWNLHWLQQGLFRRQKRITVLARQRFLGHLLVYVPGSNP